MKPILLFVLLLICKQYCSAQKWDMGDNGVYAVVNDNDGFTNVRAAPNAKASIIGKIYSYQVFTCEANKTNWWPILYVESDSTGKADWLEGFIYKTKVSFLPKWKPVNAKSGEIKVDLQTSAYTNKKHKFQKTKDGSYLIDGRQFWGTDGEHPKTAITSVKITVNNIEIVLPSNTYNDLYEPNLKTLSYTRGPGNTVYIRMDNSDGAGAYTIIWIIKDNKYYGRYIDDSLA